MNKLKKSSLIIGIVGLILVLTGVTYSFFNYTRTGLANNFRVGNISFNTSQDGVISLTNVFPITNEELDEDVGNHDSVEISITGNTIYSKGIEYLVTFEVSGNRNIISVLINTYVFNGGAHGNTSLIALNYDLNTGKYIDIRQASLMEYNQISSICRETLYKRLIDNEKSAISPTEKDALKQMINTGAFPQAGNFEIFTVDGSKIFVLFEPYSVAPYSYGIQKIQIK